MAPALQADSCPSKQQPKTLPVQACLNKDDSAYVPPQVGQRAGMLVGAAVAALVRHMGRDVPSTHIDTDGEIAETAGQIPTTIIAADGSMVLKYDKFRCAPATACSCPRIATRPEHSLRLRSGRGCFAISLKWSLEAWSCRCRPSFRRSRGCRLAIQVAVQDTCGKQVAQNIHLVPTEDGCAPAHHPPCLHRRLRVMGHSLRSGTGAAATAGHPLELRAWQQPKTAMTEEAE